MPGEGGVEWGVPTEPRARQPMGRRVTAFSLGPDLLPRRRHADSTANNHGSVREMLENRGREKRGRGRGRERGRGRGRGRERGEGGERGRGERGKRAGIPRRGRDLHTQHNSSRPH